MNIKQLYKKNIYLAPYNQLTKTLVESKEFKNNLNFLGFIEQNTNDEKRNISTINNINKEFDSVIIMSPNYFIEITKKLLNNNISNDKIFYCNSLLNSEKYNLTQSKFLYKYLCKTNSFYEQFLIKFYNVDFYKLNKMKNTYSSKKTRAFILGNGPSLKIKDLELLKDEITFAANKIYLSFPETNWRPTYYFVIDRLVYTQNYNEIRDLKLNKFFPTQMIQYNKKIENSTYFQLNYMPPVEFSPTPMLNGMFSGRTVVFAMLEYAVFMGIKELYIIGLDFSFDLPEKSNIIELVSKEEINHFHKDYRKTGEKWTKPDMKLQRESFLKAKEYAQKHGIRIYNASRETKLDVFERIDFDLLFEKEQ